MVEDMTKKGLPQLLDTKSPFGFLPDCQEMGYLQELTHKGNWVKRQLNSRRFFGMR